MERMEGCVGTSGDKDSRRRWRDGKEKENKEELKEMERKMKGVG